MFKRTDLMRNIITSVAAAIGSTNKPSKNTPASRLWVGVGPKRTIITLHKEVAKSKLSRYPKPHQGAQECARRLNGITK